MPDHVLLRIVRCGLCDRNLYRWTIEQNPKSVKRTEETMEPIPKKLLDQVRDALRPKHYSYRTEQAYVGWITRYVLFHDTRHPRDIGAPRNLS
jgi:hypothetical protein